MLKSLRILAAVVVLGAGTAAIAADKAAVATRDGGRLTLRDNAPGLQQRSSCNKRVLATQGIDPMTKRDAV